MARLPAMRIRVFFDFKHAASFCLGTIQACTHVQLALACQQSLLKVQHRSRFTMQHVSGHTGNLGNECADHAASLGHSVLYQVMTSLHVVHITPLILLHALLLVTTLVMSWRTCMTLELK